MNCVQLVGHLSKDPELRYTGNGTPIAQITVAVNREFTGKDGKREADFINVVVWQKQAEAVSQYLKKGRLVSVAGRLQVRSYEAKEGGKRWVTEVVADRVNFLDRAKEDGAGNGGGTGRSQNQGYGNRSGGSSQQQPQQGFDDEPPFFDDDVPF